MMKNYFCHAVKATMICLACFISLTGNATEMPHYKVKVVTELLEPYQMYDSQGALDGFATEVVKALFQQANADADINVLPWARAYSTALNVKDVKQRKNK